MSIFNEPVAVSPEEYQRANLLAQREARQNHQMGEWNGVKVYRIKEFKSTMEAERQLNISNGTICMACKGTRKTAGKYKWEYAV